MTLKITAADLQLLTAAVKPLDTPERRELYRTGQFRNAHICKDLNLRYRWDLLYASGVRIGDGIGIKGDINLYAYMNDSHIDSALRSFIPALELQPATA